MPIWKESEKYNLKIHDLNNPDYNWSHCGMNAETARKLHQQTLYDVRWQNEYAVAVEWQLQYDLPLNPSLNFTDNYRIEKLIERLAFVENDFSNDEEKINDTIERLGLKEIENNNVKDISTGQKQRVAIARTLVKDANIILADEPTGSLDSKTSSKILKQLIDLHKDKNVTLIIVTHDMDVAKLADRVIEVLDGEIISAGDDSLINSKINV